MDDRVNAVQKMQDYIGAHLRETITPAALSRACGYSPWHATRLFTELLGMTPADYIRRLRLSRSALCLRDEKARVTDVAFDAGFESVDGYTRAFCREFGCTPGDYARRPVPLWLFYPYDIKSSISRKETNMQDTKTVFIQPIEKPARKALIKRGVKADDYWTYCEEVGCDVWGLLKSIRSLGGEPVCLWLPPQYVAPGTSTYVQGVEVPLDYDGEVPEGFDVIELPACAYLMFRGEPFAEEDYCEAIQHVWQAEEKYDPSLTGYAWEKSSPRVQLEPIGTRGYIELLPVRSAR